MSRTSWLLQTFIITGSFINFLSIVRSLCKDFFLMSNPNYNPLSSLKGEVVIVSAFKNKYERERESNFISFKI